MAPKLVLYSRHAKQRMKLRGITRRNVRWLLNAGARTKISEGKFEARGYLGRRQASVIYTEDARRILVFTVQWIGGDD